MTGFADIAEVADGFAANGYITDHRLATTVFLMSRLEKPVLLEGPAGVGKTELAKTLDAVTGRRLLRLQCYEGQDETKALYEWDYGKQMLYTQMLREKVGQIVGEATDRADEALAGRLIQIVRRLRALDLRKAPSISETIDWARTLAVLGVAELDAVVLSDTISVVAKYEKDVTRSRESLPRLIARLTADPNVKRRGGEPARAAQGPPGQAGRPGERAGGSTSGGRCARTSATTPYRSGRSRRR